MTASERRILLETGPIITLPAEETNMTQPKNAVFALYFDAEGTLLTVDRGGQRIGP